MTHRALNSPRYPTFYQASRRFRCKDRSMTGPILRPRHRAHHPTKSTPAKGKVAQNRATALSLRGLRGFCHGEFAGVKRDGPQIVERPWS
jgi:hypothetical protein